jgi:hypothetical protein
VIRAFQPDKPQMRKLRSVSFHGRLLQDSPSLEAYACYSRIMSSAFLACNHFVFDARAFVCASGVNASKFPKPEVVLQGPCQALFVTRLFVVVALLPRRCFTGDLFFLF